MSYQPAFAFWGQEQPRPHKRQRQTARAVYSLKRDEDQAKASAGRETRAGQVLRILAWHWNENQASPTALELLAWARAKGERLFDVNSIRPRLKELVDGGLVEPRAKRTCQVSGQTVWTWAVREAGSQEPACQHGVNKRGQKCFWLTAV